ncbi:MAG TPA: LPS assembly lipoprotein LptE [Casimicrobiaceae bacterium]|nr:LPS assembly lipoprotein LptE [Casimicrobiaceae bacterium]
MQRALSIARMSIAVVLSCALAACGFHLRGEAKYTFTSIYVNGAGAPSLAAELARALAAASSARVVDSAKDAQVILDIPSVVDDKEVLSLTGAGSVREYELIKRVDFRLRDADGGQWLPPGEITLRRSYSFSESEALAREAQEQRLLKEMQSDAVQQLVRRLQAARKPG